MALHARLTSLARNLFRKQRAERDLDEELRSYFELLGQEKEQVRETFGRDLRFTFRALHKKPSFLA
jgi:hypothetical protein